MPRFRILIASIPYHTSRLNMQWDRLAGSRFYFQAYFLWYTKRNARTMVAEKTPRRTELVFFRNNTGNEPVREWLKRLNAVERRAIGTDLLRAQWRWPIGMPLCRPMGQRLWEVRTDLPGNRTARVLICFYDTRLVVLHGFIKKARATPGNDLALARKRQKELEQ